jgi:hypothetical protein
MKHSKFVLRYQGIIVAVVLIGLVSFRLWLSSGRPLEALITFIHDDGLFFNLAQSIVAGEWLGEYNERTLIKGPGYPLWMAVMHLLGIPLLTSHHLAYIGATFLLSIALYPLHKSKWIGLVIFALFLFNPLPFFGRPVDSFSRQYINLPIAIICAATAIGTILRRDRRLSVLTTWIIGLGLSIGYLRITRGEYVWITPLVVSVVLSIIVHYYSLSKRVMVNLLLLLLLSGLLVPSVVRVINYRVYGAAIVDEFSSQSLLGAYGALTRIKHMTWLPHIPVPRSSWYAAASVSPAFSKLMPSLLGEIGQNWTMIGDTEMLFGGVSVGLPQEFGEIPGGWFVFAFREALWDSNEVVDLPSSLAYYDQIAIEINDACDLGKIDCYPKKRVTFMPLLSQNYFLPIYDSVLIGWKVIQSPYYIAHHGLYQSTGTDEQILLVRQFTHETNIVTNQQPREVSDLKLTRKFQLLNSINLIYQWLFPKLFLLALLVMLVQIGDLFKRKNAFVHMSIALGILFSVVALVLGIAFIDVSSFPAIHLLYLAPAHLYLWIFVIWQLLLGWKMMKMKLML